MSDTQTSNSAGNSAQKVVIVSQKSAVIGFVLSVFIGMFGIDRLYKGDKVLALLKFLCALGFLFCFLGYLMEMGFTLLFAFQEPLAIFASKPLLFCAFDVLWYFADWILVPLGISRDNAKRLAAAQNGGVEFAQNKPKDDPYEYAPRKPLLNLSERTTKLVAAVVCALLLVGILAIYGYLWATSQA